MNIYEGEGVDAIVDLRAAAAELKKSASITNDGVRRQTVAEIQTATLLDIALSLRVVAAEARAAMPPLFAEETTVEPEPDRDFLIVGDLVIVEGMDEPGEVKALGVSEGAVWADVLFANGAESRVWQDQITRLVGDEMPAESVEEVVAVVAEELAAKTDPDVVIDDIDDDFDGDHHTAAATALDTLKENERARKAAKKGKKK